MMNKTTLETLKRNAMTALRTERDPARGNALAVMLMQVQAAERCWRDVEGDVAALHDWTVNATAWLAQGEAAFPLMSTTDLAVHKAELRTVLETVVQLAAIANLSAERDALAEAATREALAEVTGGSGPDFDAAYYGREEWERMEAERAEAVATGQAWEPEEEGNGMPECVVFLEARTACRTIGVRAFGMVRVLDVRAIEAGDPRWELTLETGTRCRNVFGVRAKRLRRRAAERGNVRLSSDAGNFYVNAVELEALIAGW